jgi:hypothetical protein
MKAVAPLFALFATVSAFAAPAVAAASTPAAQSGYTVDADLNGDGRLDRVSVAPIAGNPSEQSLVATIGRVNYVAHVPVDQPSGVQPLRVTDMNGDGRQEVVVTETVGVNTNWMTVWGMFGGLRAVTRDGQHPMTLFEGGGNSAISRYGCEYTSRGRELVDVSAESTDVTFTNYEGARTTYTITSGGWAVQTSSTYVTGPYDTAGFQADSNTCA